MKPVPTEPDKPRPEPDAIKVQHILIGFSGAVGAQRLPLLSKAHSRNRAEAEALVASLTERVRKGEDFKALMVEFSDDSGGGEYGMVNDNKPPRPGYSLRKGMVPAFGDTGFPLEVGEIGVATYDATSSPYGFHIVKRIE